MRHTLSLLSFLLSIYPMSFPSLCLSSALELEPESTTIAFNTESIKISDSTRIKNMYQLMKDVHELFEKNGITYWANGGTLLGCVRHGGMIPWDDDLDIAIDQQDVSKVQAIESQLEAIGYELIITHWLIIQLKEGSILDNRRIFANKYVRWPWIDIFVFKKEGSKYVHATQHTLQRWPGDEFTVESINNKRLSSFGSFKIWIPANTEDQLRNFYGKDALTHGFWQGYHGINYDETKVRIVHKWLLQDADKLPAPLTGQLEDRIDK